MVNGANIDEITILVGSLALLVPHPDWSIWKMLVLIEGTPPGMSVDEMERRLRGFLIENGELHADHFNETMDTLLHGNALMIDRAEFMPIYEQLKLIHGASALAIERPRSLYPSGINWQAMQELMRQFSVPPVTVRNSVLYQVGGVDANRQLHRLISLIHHKLF